MEAISIKEIVNAVQGNLICGDETAQVTSVTTNSKEVFPGALFVPIVGERVDGHKFIESAFASGAAATFTSLPIIMEEVDLDFAYIQVENTLEALQKLGAYYRNKFNIPVIGITGSVGKTTTKEMIAAALETKKTVLKTEGNMNSQIGLPLMMFRMEKKHEIAVIEMGMSEEGEMSRLANIARPSTAVVTNIGVSHIGQLGSQENIRKEKLNIINNFNKNSMLYLNGNDSLLLELETWKQENKAPLAPETEISLMNTELVYYGTEPHCRYYAKNIRTVGEETHFTCEYPKGTEKIVLSVLGMHNVGNALVALAIAEQFGIEPSVAKQGLREYKPIAMRGQIMERNGIKLIDDSYNASPDSMKSGIQVLLQLSCSNRRIAVLADVLELGELSYECHYGVGSYIAGLEQSHGTVDEVITIGKEASAITKAVEAENNRIHTHSFDSNQEAIQYLKSVLQSGDAVLVKGSRGMHTDEIVKAIME